MQKTSGQKENKLLNNLGGFEMRKFLKQLLNKRLKNEKGLTLIELLAVIVILGIIAAIAVPAIGNIINNSSLKAAKADVVNIINAANIYFTDNNKSNGDTVNQTEIRNYLESYGVFEGKEFTVTKGSPSSFSLKANTTITAGGKTISITGATIDNIQVENANEVTTVFDF